MKSLSLLWVAQKFAISLHVMQRKGLVYPTHSGIPRNCSGEPLSYKIEKWRLKERRHPFRVEQLNKVSDGRTDLS